MMLSISSFSLCLEFIERHPGLILVLIGVAGEIFFDWGEMGGKLERAKKASAILLVFGLTLEFWEAAKSDNEIAAMRKQTADALLETERIKALVAWRDITPEQIQKFKNSMKELPKGNVRVNSPSSDAEAATFGHKLAEMLKESGFSVTEDLSSFVLIGGIETGIWLKIKSQEHEPRFAGPLQRSLQAIGIDAQARIDGVVGADDVMLTVGSKPMKFP
jgi:hypothetical protein